ncbi:MAG: hypothetical protein KKA73_13580 [Chloroflexi bacterium]|nr:hypothetical protein [Chloroflexota bacterium]MBU1748713.1 hypothetical protein [Chloroflexota bacterium]
MSEYDVLITGPQARYGQHFVKCLVHDAAGTLVSPADVQWHLQKFTGGDVGDDAAWGYDERQLVGYDKGPGQNEFTLFGNRQQKYRLRLEDTLIEDPALAGLSNWGVLDFAQPIAKADNPAGWEHLYFEAAAWPVTAEPPTPPPPGPDCDNCPLTARVAQLEGAIADMRALAVTMQQVADGMVSQ